MWRLFKNIMPLKKYKLQARDSELIGFGILGFKQHTF
jgi:hypothetical protein